jgi:hypothetical protein
VDFQGEQHESVPEESVRDLKEVNANDLYEHRDDSMGMESPSHEVNYDYAIQDMLGPGFTYTNTDESDSSPESYEDEESIKSEDDHDSRVDSCEIRSTLCDSEATQLQDELMHHEIDNGQEPEPEQKEQMETLESFSGTTEVGQLSHKKSQLQSKLEYLRLLILK